MPRTPWEITREMFLSESEVQELLAHLERRVSKAEGRELLGSMTDRFIVASLLFSGLRPSEFCSLLLGDVSTTSDKATFCVRDRAKEKRVVYLPRSVGQLVRGYVLEVRPSFLPDDVSSKNPTGHLVFNEHRRPYERTALYRRVVRILTEAGLGDRASVQLLRHTYGYLAYLRTGGNLLFVQRQLGHSHPMITSIYSQFVDESYSAIANKLISD